LAYKQVLLLKAAEVLAQTEAAAEVLVLKAAAAEVLVLNR